MPQFSCKYDISVRFQIQKRKCWNQDYGLKIVFKWSWNSPEIRKKFTKFFFKNSSDQRWTENFFLNLKIFFFVRLLEITGNAKNHWKRNKRTYFSLIAENVVGDWKMHISGRKKLWRVIIMKKVMLLDFKLFLCLLF